ncbi:MULTISPECIES: ComEA family DNA-binding protein [unclassified Agromyces]|uniref:ComEA family DNA-binding protein n=1 Tax=unclassified Agromyces TaxID=2639701 RepID=UPI0030146004
MPVREPSESTSTERSAPADPLAALDGARVGPRRRIAVGAAVVVFVAAVATSAVAAFASGGGGPQGEVVAPGVQVEGVGSTDAAADGGPSGAAPSATLLVHVLGAVARPGIVELAPGARVVDAVGAAGGLTAEADAGGVNLARALVDGEQLVVPVVGATPAGAAEGVPPTGGGVGGDGRVSLNRADVAELDTLPRIGPALAQRIVDWREANGPFTDVAQLLDVAGIGDAVYSGVVDLVTL